MTGIRFAVRCTFASVGQNPRRAGARHTAGTVAAATGCSCPEVVIGAAAEPALPKTMSAGRSANVIAPTSFRPVIRRG
jgi:hypothetical protein